jgi:hypothetical protein
MNLVVITPTESDTYLSRFDDWLALDTAAKEAYIARASAYAQAQWTCVDSVVWEDAPDTTEVEAIAIPSVIKEAVAHYAYIDFHENLFGDPTTVEAPHGNLKGVTSKIGALTEQIEYFQGGAQSSIGTMSHTGYPDMLMSVYCELSDAGSRTLVRV